MFLFLFFSKGLCGIRPFWQKQENDINPGNYINNSHTDDYDSKPVDVPATVFRHTYFQNASPEKSFSSSQYDLPFPKLGGNKHTRNIRLRPRQTLCSNCKSACLDSHKGPIPISSAVASLNHSAQPPALRPQESQSSAKYEGSKNGRKRQKNNFQEPKPTKLIKVRNDDPPKLTRTSPFIKISIGETNVMNIPPRLQELEREELSSKAEKCTDVDEAIPNIETIQQVADNGEEEEDNEVIFNFKPSILRQRKEDKVKREEAKKKKSNNNHRKNRKTRQKEECDSDLLPNIIITENIDSDEEKASQNSGYKPRRPRLVYTLHQTKGLSTVSNSYSDSDDKPPSPEVASNIQPSQFENLDGTSFEDSQYRYKSKRKRPRKHYKLRSRSRSADSNPEFDLNKESSTSCDDIKSVGSQSDRCQTSDSDSSEYGDGPPGDESNDCFKPLMMKIHTTSVSTCSISDGRNLTVEDIVWGKVKGFPWWPGRVMAINISQKDNSVVIRQVAQVAWFGSSTMSHIACSDLYPFLEDFKVRFNRKKRSTSYRRAIKQATVAAQSCNGGEAIDFNDIDFSCIS